MSMSMGSENLPVIYPAFKTPVARDMRTITKMYAHFNKTYFRNELPKDIAISMAPIKSKRFLGDASVVFEREQDILVPKYAIRLSNFILGDRKIVVDTLLHEMIHIWQYSKYVGSGYDSKYLDKKAARRAHGHYFIREMDRLNKYGFGVAPTGGDDTITELEDDAFFLALRSEVHQNTIGILMCSKKDLDAQKWLDVLQRKTMQGIVSVDIYATKTTAIMQMKQASIKHPPRKLNNFYKTSYTDSLIEHVSTRHISGATNVTDVNIKLPVAAIGHKQWESEKYRNFRNYLQSLVNLMETKPTLPQRVDKDTELPGIPAQLVALAYKEWSDVDIAMLKSDSLLEPAFEGMIEAAKTDEIGWDILKAVDNAWTVTYTGRIDRKAYIKVFAEACAKLFRSRFGMTIAEARDTVDYLMEEGSIV